MCTFADVTNLLVRAITKHGMYKSQVICFIMFPFRNQDASQFVMYFKLNLSFSWQA